MDLMDLVAARIEVLTEGKWEEDDVEVEISPRYVPYIDQGMRKVAAEQFAKLQEKYPKRYYDGNVMHLDVQHSLIASDKVFLALGTIAYSIYNVCRTEVAKEYGWDVWALPVGSGTVVTVLTSDGKIVMHNRKDNSQSVITGIYEVGTPFDNMHKELCEELRVGQSNIAKMSMLGIVYRTTGRLGHSFDFVAETNLSADEIMRLQKELSEEEKEGEVFFLALDPMAVKSFLIKNPLSIAASGFACLVLTGRYLWGKEWSKIGSGGCDGKDNG